MALDRRSNKPGYQRISVACSHCRRRKIRCVVAQSDNKGRCTNCIRLKKECIFHPVDVVVWPENRALTSLISYSPSKLRSSGSKLEHSHKTGHSSRLASNTPPGYGPVDEPATGPDIFTGTPVASNLVFARLGYPAIYTNDISGTEHSTPVHCRWSQMGEFFEYLTATAEHSPSVYTTFFCPPQRAECTFQQPPSRLMSYRHIEPQLETFALAAAPLEYPRPEFAHHNLTPLYTDIGASPVRTMSGTSITPVTSEPISVPVGMYPPQWGFPQHQQ